MFSLQYYEMYVYCIENRMLTINEYDFHPSPKEKLSHFDLKDESLVELKFDPGF